MYCGKCGANINDNAVFCTECGAPMNKATNSSNSDVESENSIAVTSQIQEIIKPSKVICHDCGAKNDWNKSNCIQCGKVIDKTRLHRTCPVCSSIMNDVYEVCPVCEYNILAGRWSSAEAQRNWANPGNVSYSANVSSNSSYQSNTTYNQNKNKTATFAGIVAILVVVVAFVLYKGSTETQLALSMYNNAHNSLYNTDNTYISTKTQSLIKDAVEQADSIFVSKEVKQKISELQKDGQEFALLSEIENLAVSHAQTNIYSIKSKMNSITSDTVKSERRYKNILPIIERTEFKISKESWAQEKLDELISTKTELISSWDRYHDIYYYTGLVSLINYGNDAICLSLEDYSGYENILYMNYNYNGNEEWNDYIDKIKYTIDDGTPCVMAALVADDQIFSCSYTHKQ